MQLLPIVQQFCLRMGLASPAAVAGSTDRMISQIMALANEVLEDLTRWEWQELVREATFTTVAATNQGSLDTIAPNFEVFKPRTFFNRTQKLEVEGPLSAQEWQAIQATTFSAPRYYWRIVQNQLWLSPTPDAGQSMAFEYRTKALIYNATSSSYKELFTADNDEFLLDPRLLTYGLRWLWKKEKGLSYDEEFRKYEELCLKLAGVSGGGRTLSMGEVRAVSPGIIVPSGNWNLP